MELYKTRNSALYFFIAPATEGTFGPNVDFARKTNRQTDGQTDNGFKGVRSKRTVRSYIGFFISMSGTYGAWTFSVLGPILVIFEDKNAVILLTGEFYIIFLTFYSSLL